MTVTVSPPLNILFDYQIFSLQQYGGISRYFSEMFGRMNQFEGCQAAVFCPLSVNHYLAELPHGGITIPKIPRTGNLVRLANKYASRCYAAAQKFDIVHKTYFFDQSKMGARTVVTVYDMINELYPQYFPDDDHLAKHKAAAVKRADAIICISESTRADLLNFIDIDPEKVFVTHLGFSSLPETDSEGRSGPMPKPYLLYVGKRGGHKNFETMAAGFAASRTLRRDFHLLCFGDVPFSQEEKNMMASLGLPPTRVHHFTGGDALLAKAYRHAAAFVYPSRYEGFGIPVLEAMSCRCPVVCSHAGSLGEVAGDAAEIFDPLDVDAVRAALENVLYDSSRASELVQRGAERCRRFTWEKCARETLDVYRAT